MSDTQWPRYQVFKQDRPDRPHENVGSVHAPDDEMALLNARDIFVRRPECVSLWVVPAEHIYSKTAQELAQGQLEEGDATETPAEAYHVFQKLSHLGSHRWVGTVDASSPSQALRQAIETFRDERPLVWWVFPARQVTRSHQADIPSMFEPAKDKDYRDQASYRTQTEMQRIKRERHRREDAHGA